VNDGTDPHGDGKPRCAWAGEDPLYVAYHDAEWGLPQHDDRYLFEFLILEGVQAGLSWLLILKKRNHYRRVFDRFDPEKVAAYDRGKVEALIDDAGIIRNRLKIEAAIVNANAFLSIRKEYHSFDAYIWDFVGGQAIKNAWGHVGQIPAQTDISRRMSKDLKKRGFKFVGPTICYAFMQAVGLVNDHTIDCFRYDEV